MLRKLLFWLLYWATIIIPALLMLVSAYFINVTGQKLIRGNLSLIDSLGQNKGYVIITILVVLITIVSFPISTRLKIIANQEILYENGRNKKFKDYNHLSKKEREEIDKRRIELLEQILDSNDLKARTKKGSKYPDKDMEELKGMDNVKEQMELLVARMKHGKKGSTSTTHFCFIGSAGTGKTTVARIMTGFLYKYGYIKKNQCVEVDGNFLKSGVATSIKTEEIVKASFGGVLFIDEAYALLEGNGYEGKEAIATLVKCMEDNRDKFILILAGYKEEMKLLINSNTGFYSRIKHFIKFEDYTPEVLYEIFKSMAKEKGYEVEELVREKFLSEITTDMNMANFGNARTVRNYLDKTIDRHLLNYDKGNYDKAEKFTLKANDFTINAWEREFFG